MKGILLTAYTSARSGENEFLLFHFLPLLLKTIFAYSMYAVKMITLLIESLINLISIFIDSLVCTYARNNRGSKGE